MTQLEKFEELAKDFGLNIKKVCHKVSDMTMFDRSFKVDTRIEVGDADSKYACKGVYLFFEGKFMGLDPRG